MRSSDRILKARRPDHHKWPTSSAFRPLTARQLALGVPARTRQPVGVFRHAQGPKAAPGCAGNEKVTIQVDGQSQLLMGAVFAGIGLEQLTLRNNRCSAERKNAGQTECECWEALEHANFLHGGRVRGTQDIVYGRRRCLREMGGDRFLGASVARSAPSIAATHFGTDTGSS